MQGFLFEINQTPDQNSMFTFMGHKIKKTHQGSCLQPNTSQFALMKTYLETTNMKNLSPKLNKKHTKNELSKLNN
jgi:hypothetical protein